MTKMTATRMALVNTFRARPYLETIDTLPLYQFKDLAQPPNSVYYGNA
jgi:hypothetical protein